MTRAALFVFCLVNAALAQPFRWTTFTSASHAVDLLMTESSVWTATSGGLARFDLESGEIEVYTNTRGLAMNNCSAVGQDNRGWIWAALADGRITRVEPATGDVRQNDDLSGDVFDITKIMQLDDDVFISTNNGIYRFQYLELADNFRVRESIRVLGQFPSNSAVSTLAATDSFIYAGTAEGLARADRDSEILSAPAVWENFTTGNSGLPQNTVLALFRDSSDRLWISTPQNTVLFDGILWSSAQPLDSVIAFTELSGAIYAATRHFIYRHDQSGWTAVSSDFLNITAIMSSETDSGIYLSVGDAEQRAGGVAFWSLTGEQGPVNNPGLGGNEIMEVEVDEGGRAWITTAGLRNGYSIYNDGEWSGRTRDAENSQHYFRNQPQNIAFDGFGGAWLASQGGGVVWVRDDSIVFFDRSIQSGFDVNGPRILGHNEVSSFMVTRVTEDKEGGIYISNRLTTPGPGPSLIHVTRNWIAQGNHPEPWIYYTIPQFVSPGNPTEVEELLTDPYGRVWVGASPDGNQTSVLQPANPDDWFGYDPRERQDDAFTCFRDIDTQVQTWAVDHQNYLWVGTPTGAYYTQGGIPLSLNQLHFICVIDMPIGNRVNDIHVDSQDNKWFATDEGVAVLDKDFNWIHVFQTASSVDYPSNLTSNSVTSITSNPGTGEIWIGTQDGLSLLESPYISRTADLDELMLYPNPYRADGTQRLYVDAMSLGGTFDEMRVFTTTGRLVRELTWNTMINTGWDGRNGEGNLVAGGVYLVVVTTAEGSSVTGKVAVLGK